MINVPSVLIVTDGSIFPNPGTGGWASIVRRKTDSGIMEQIITGRDENMATNITMEMSAVIAGLNSLDRPSDVHLITDLQMIVFGIKQYIPNWVSRGWRNSHGETPANVGLWKQIYTLTQIHNVTVEWTKGHVGHELNTRADKLAGKARMGELTNTVKFIEGASL